MRWILCTLAVLVLSRPGHAEDLPATPKGVAPLFGLASAVEKDGKVVVELFEARRDVARIPVMDHDEFVEIDHWVPLATVALDKGIRAYRLDGKSADPKEVLRALEKRRSVVYFLGYDKATPVRPDPFYLSVLEKGSVVLALEIPERAPPPTP